jgi:E3 ubiquitin-protein ligase makorin
MYANYNENLIRDVNSRACPECRVTSDFVCPSMYWVDTKEEKEKLIKDYKSALR